MDQSKTALLPQKPRSGASLAQVLPATLIATMLTLILAVEPRLVLPLAAFAAMAVLTVVLGQRLFREFSGSAAAAAGKAIH